MTAALEFDPRALARRIAPGLGPVVVTGAGGFIGKRLVRMLVEAGAEVTGWTRADLDLTDPAAVAFGLSSARPRTVFHLAATGLVGRPEPAVALAENVAMCRNLAGAMEPGSVLVYAGSVSEYGRGGVLEESGACLPRTDYGQAKLAAGLGGAAAAKQRQVRFVHARLFGVYGPGEPDYRLFPAVLDALSVGKVVELSDCLQQRDFVHVDDACAAMIVLASADPPTTPINIGTGTAVTVRETVEWVADSLGAERDLLQFGARARSIHDEDLIMADDSRLVAAIGRKLPQRLGPGFDLALLQPIPVSGESPCR